MLLPPRVSHDQAEEIAAAHYGVSAVAERLAAEHDDTFRLVTAGGPTRLLKIAQIPPGTLADAGASPTAASFQTAVLLHLARAAPALPVQRVISTLDGRPELHLDGRVVRMTSYLEGPVLGSRPASAALRRDIGGTLARLDQALRPFAHPGANRTHLWDLQNFHQLRPLLDQLPGQLADRDQRAALVSCLDRFEARVLPRLADPATRRQVIHTDFHGDNLLAAADRVTGVLDFGDSLAGPVAMDVGVAACYQFGDAAGTDPLIPALDVIAGYHAVDPLGPGDPALIGEFMLLRLAARIIVSQWNAAREPANRDYLLRRTPQATAHFAALRAIGPARGGEPDKGGAGMTGSDGTGMDAARMVNGFDTARTGALDPELGHLVRRRDAALGGAYRLFYATPVQFARGEGVYLYDPDGTAYLDAYNNVPSVGHSHPRVTEAVSRQLQTLNTHTRYLTAGLVDYAERLLATHQLGPAHAMFTCTGSEANDLALRIARHHTGGTGVIVTANAYHGVTSAVAEVSPSLGVPLGRHVRAVPAPPDAAAVAAAIADLERHGVRLAAFLADSLLSSDGVLPDPAGFLKPVQDVVRAAGGLYIADEVQSGFGRTGGHLWGYQRHGLDPDIVVMGKPMGNGLPIAGIVVRREVLADFGAAVRYFNTFGGNPVCVAAAAAVLDVLDAEELPANAAAVGGYLTAELGRVAAASPLLGEVRGAGLYLGADVVDPATGAPSGARAAAIVNGMRDRRVLISATGPLGHTLKIRPPLPFSRANADQLLEALTDTLANLP